MLDKIDLSKKIAKSEYKKLMAPLLLRLAELQRTAREMGIPVAVVFEGWDAAGKGTLINSLSLALDPRGCKVHPINAPTEEELLRPWLWRFWARTPESGRAAVFDRSWYGRVLVERVDGIVKKKEWATAYEEITTFERQLADSGTVIVKLFLHIRKKEQKKRFKKLLENPATSWKVTKDDWRRHEQYDEYVDATEEMLEKTSTQWAPWTVVESHDRRYAAVKAFAVLIEALQWRIAEKTGTTAVRPTPAAKSAPRTSSLESAVLDKVDLSLSMDAATYDEQMDRLQARLRDLEHQIYRKRIPVVIAYEGWDAAGKGGNIRRMVQGMDPRGYEVVPFAAPSDVEKRHHYLWRFWTVLPKAGHITIYDRTWYGRVLVERVEGFCAETDWRRAYREINEMEEHWARFGVAIVKFWLHIDRKEQLRRFKARQAIAYKQWKITDEDWRNREKWNAYRAAVDEMLLRTSTSYAPWTIVEANCKLYARVKTLSTVVQRLEQAL
jgi:polyphosphate kinase 2 (PPK2 family)